MAQKLLIEAINDALREEMRRDPSVFCIGQDIGTGGGVFLVTQGLQNEFGADRAIDSPLAESAIIGVSIGAAVNGMRPVAEMQFFDYILPAMEQIINEAAKLRWRSANTWGVPMVMRAPTGGGVTGALYHSQSLEALFTNIPGLKVVLPATPYDAKGLMKAAIRDPDPVLYLEHKKTYRSIRAEVPDGDFVVPIGRADVKRPGTSLTIVTWGLMVHYALEAAGALAQEGIDVEVIDLRTLLPVDNETILESVRKTGKALVVYEANRTGGFGGEIASTIAEFAFEHLDGPVTRLASPDIPAMPWNHPQEDFFMLSPEKIAAAARKLAAY